MKWISLPSFPDEFCWLDDEVLSFCEALLGLAAEEEELGTLGRTDAELLDVTDVVAAAVVDNDVDDNEGEKEEGLEKKAGDGDVTGVLFQVEVDAVFTLKWQMLVSNNIERVNFSKGKQGLRASKDNTHRGRRHSHGESKPPASS